MGALMRALCGGLVALFLAVTGLGGQVDRTDRSLQEVVAATSEMAQEVRARALWEWPLPGRPRVARPFDPPEERWLPGHRGVDLIGLTSSPVLAVADGTVTYSGSIAGVGIVSVTHADGIRSTYQPVTDRVEQGQVVRTGDRLGWLGVWGSHCLIWSCLHLGAVSGKDHYLDPLLFLQPWELTLLPHAE